MGWMHTGQDHTHTAPPTDSLDEAWREAEAALPDGWGLEVISWDGDSLANVYPPGTEADPDPASDIRWSAPGATPAAALRALAVKMRLASSRN